MARITVRYVCQACGAESLRWMGRCSQCGEWNTLVEETVGSTKKQQQSWVKRSNPVPLTQISTSEQPRFSTGIIELTACLEAALCPGVWA